MDDAGRGNTIDCRSELGVTVGLVDSIITALRVLCRGRDLSPTEVAEALADLGADEDLRHVLSAAGYRLAGPNEAVVRLPAPDSHHPRDGVPRWVVPRQGMEPVYVYGMGRADDEHRTGLAYLAAARWLAGRATSPAEPTGEAGEPNGR